MLKLRFLPEVSLPHHERSLSAPARLADRSAPIGRTCFAAALLAQALALALAFASTPATSAASDRTIAGSRQTAGDLLISAVFADGYAPRDADEAVQIWNVGDEALDLSGWSLRDDSDSARFPSETALTDGAMLSAGAFVWLARDAQPFARSFGHAPDWAWGDPFLAEGTSVKAMSSLGAGPTLANAGDVIHLVDPTGGVADTVVYGDGSSSAWEIVEGWIGPAIDVYHPGVIGRANQILYRALDPAPERALDPALYRAPDLDPAVVQPYADTDTAADWASYEGDPVRGRRARFPGWDLEAVLAAPWRFEEAARLEVAVAPDGLYSFLDRHIAAAEASIDVFVYTFEHPSLAERLAARARAGVRVRLLVDGAPAGGHDPTGRWCLNLLAESGADVRFLDSADGIRARYRSQHAKIVVIDGRTVLVGTENPTLGSAPVDGTAGRRGVWVATDSPGVVAWAKGVIARDFDPDRHVDLRPFQARDPTRGAPAPDFEPERAGGGPGNMPRWAEGLALHGRLDIETITAPETTRSPGRGVLGLVARAGAGDVVRVAQLREPVWWGGGEAEGEIARNPRLVASLDAARRGARVRVMLDGYFDDPEHPNSNAAAVAWLRERAAAESLDLEARTANPTGRGLHAKVILVDRNPGGSHGALDPERWIHVGSINGTEVASLVNREAALTILSAPAHDLLAEVFDTDFVRGFHPIWLPWAVRP